MARVGSWSASRCAADSSNNFNRSHGACGAARRKRLGRRAAACVRGHWTFAAYSRVPVLIASVARLLHDLSANMADTLLSPVVLTRSSFSLGITTGPGGERSGPATPSANARSRACRQPIRPIRQSGSYKPSGLVVPPARPISNSESARAAAVQRFSQAPAWEGHPAGTVTTSGADTMFGFDVRRWLTATLRPSSPLAWLFSKTSLTKRGRPRRTTSTSRCLKRVQRPGMHGGAQTRRSVPTFSAPPCSGPI
jgi:hypothetical protein